MQEEALAAEEREYQDDLMYDGDFENELPGEQELFEHYRFVVDKGQSMLRIDKYLVNIMASISRNRIQDAAIAGNIRVNDISVKPSYRVKPGDVITIVLAYPPSEFVIVPQDIPLTLSLIHISSPRD